MRRAFVSVAVGGAFVAALGAAAACLPDLAALPPEAEEVGEAGEPQRCGDGLIETLTDGGDSGESCDPGEAGSSSCQGCRIVCEGVLDELGTQCYFTAGSATGYQEAIQLCLAAGARVVTIASAEEGALVDAVTGDAVYWIGLAVSNELGGAFATPSRDEPGWPAPGAAPCSGCFGPGADDAGSFPSALDAGEAPCLVAERGVWRRVPCVGSERAFSVVCERAPIGSRTTYCQGPFCATVPATLGRKRYLLHVVGATAAEAETACASQGGRLVHLDSREEREELVRAFAEVSSVPTSAWIGLSFADGRWRWDDGEGVDGGRPDPWGSGQPAGTGAGRAFVRISNALFDTQLAYSDEEGAPGVRPFICERP